MVCNTYVSDCQRLKYDLVPRACFLFGPMQSSQEQDNGCTMTEIFSINTIRNFTLVSIGDAPVSTAAGMLAEIT